MDWLASFPEGVPLPDAVPGLGLVPLPQLARLNSIASASMEETIFFIKLYLSFLLIFIVSAFGGVHHKLKFSAFMRPEG